MVDFNKIDDFEDKSTWDLISEGNTKGVFQLESKLGSSWAKRVKPRSIEELSDLIAIIRPGTLDTIVDGKSMTRHYVDRKHGKEPVTYVHECLEPILKKTYGVLVYQEQAIQISMDVAGFTPEEGDTLRKAVGKKDAALMNVVKSKFIEGCTQRHGLNSDQAEETFLHVSKSYEDDINKQSGKKTIAEEIFSQIEASARYSFNKCLDPETIVEYEDGTFSTLEHIKIGSRIKSPDGYIEVLNLFNNGPMETVEITLESGKSITCTIDHKFLCEDGIIRPLYEILTNSYEIVCDDD